MSWSAGEPNPPGVGGAKIKVLENYSSASDSHSFLSFVTMDILSGERTPTLEYRCFDGLHATGKANSVDIEAADDDFFTVNVSTIM